MTYKLLKLSRYTYLILSVLMLAFGFLWVVKGHWGGDFFTHAAVVNELKKHPLHPSHPIVVSGSSHPFYSPYTLLVATAARLTGVSAISALEAGAIFNLLLFLACFYYFCSPLFERHRSVSVTAALILVLFLWGTGAYHWSGFSHFACFWGVLPYPSTFALVLVFFISGLVIRRSAPTILFVAVVLSSVTLLTHPNTWTVLWPLLFSIFHFTRNQTIVRSGLKTAAILLAGAVLACFWPYFSIPDLLRDPDPVFHSDSLALFQHPLFTLWPLLLMVPAYFLGQKTGVSRLLLFNSIVCLLIYLLSYITGQYGLGRTISAAMMMMQLLVAHTLTNPSDTTKPKIPFKGLIVLCVLICIIMNLAPLKDTVSVAARKRQVNYYRRFQFISDYVKINACVMAPEGPDLILPAFGVRVVANRFPLHGIVDASERRAATRLFFSDTASRALRRSLLLKHKARFFVLTEPGTKIPHPAELGTLVNENNGVALYEFDGISE